MYNLLLKNTNVTHELLSIDNKYFANILALIMWLSHVLCPVERRFGMIHRLEEIWCSRTSLSRKFFVQEHKGAEK